MEENYNKSLPKIPEDVLQDLCSRFLINIPEQEKNDMVRICFQIELAHWYYIDFFRQHDQDLPVCGMKDFITIIFSEFKFLNKSKAPIQTIYENWKQYKVRVPVYGAILLDESLEKCLLVQGFHNKTSWGFPKGKVNKDEADIDCAIREVWEEVGYNIKPLVKPDQFLENNIHDHQVRLYIVPGVKEDFQFQPNTRGEIKEIKWFNIDVLPTHKKDMTPKDEIGLMANNFFMIHAFIRPLRKWVSEKKASMSYHSLQHSFHSVFTPTSKSSNNKMPYESREDLKKRREKESEEFRRMHMLLNPLGSGMHMLLNPLGSGMHMLLNPLGSGKSDEDALKSLLGVQGTDDSRKTPTHMESNRKFTNSLDASPRSSEKQRQRSNSHLSNRQTRSPNATNYYEGGMKKDEKKNSQNRLNKNTKETGKILRNFKDSTCDTSRNFKNQTPLSGKKKQVSNNRNTFYLEQSTTNLSRNNTKTQYSQNKNTKTNHTQLSQKLSDFEFSAPAFMEFRLDYQSIMAALSAI